MDFKTSTFMYLIAAFVVLFVLADSLFFLIRAWRRGKTLGMDTSLMKRVMVQSGLFSFPAAISIVMTVVALSGALGIVLPWIRLSVIGSVTYEVPLAVTALEAVGAKGGLVAEVTDPKAFATAAWIMTCGASIPMVIVPFATKYIQTGVSTVASKSNFVSSTLTGAAFIGLMVAFAAKAITGVGDAAVLGDGAGILSISALVVSVLTMFLLVKLNEKVKSHWLESLSMPIAMFAAMLVVVLLGRILPPDLATMEWRY